MAKEAQYLGRFSGNLVGVNGAHGFEGHDTAVDEEPGARVNEEDLEEGRAWGTSVILRNRLESVTNNSWQHCH